MKLTDALFTTTVDNIAGYISVKIKETVNISLAEAILFTRKSNTFKLLKNKKTGYYWDSISELLAMEEKEFKKKVKIHKKDFIVTKMTEKTNTSGFDIVIGNPPYVGEKGNKETFDILKKGKLGKKFYQGKMDLFYFFFHLGLDVLKDDGVLSFITTNYFSTADGAKKLRSDLKTRSNLLKLVNFNELTIFDSAKGQHDMITLLEKATNHNKETVQIVATKNVNISDQQLQSMLREEETEFSKVSSQSYDRLYDGDNNYIRFAQDNELENLLDKIAGSSSTLGALANVNQGIITGANRFTDKMASKFPKISAKKGDPIFIYPKGELKENFDIEEHLVKPWFKNSDIGRYTVNENNEEELLFTNLILEDRSQPEHMIDWFDLHQARIKDKNKKFYVLNYLRTYQELLEDRREFRSGDRAYKDLHRARSPLIFDNEKIVNTSLSFVNTFAYSNKPFFAPGGGLGGVYYITQKTDEGDSEFNAPYLLGVLNSHLIFLWLYFRGKRKGERLEISGTTLQKIPIPDPETSSKEKIDKLQKLVQKIITEKHSNPNADISELENKVNQIVYELYDLTDEEIQIVENFWKEKESERSKSNKSNANSKKQKVLEIAKENGGIVSTKKAAKAGISRNDIAELEKAGELERVERGIYSDMQSPIDDVFSITSQKFAKGIFNLNSALFLHGMTDRTPEILDMAFPFGYNPSSFKNFQINKSFEVASIYTKGVIDITTFHGAVVRAYSIERTLCDLVRPTNKVDKQIVQDAFKSYAKLDKKDLNALMEYAKLLKVDAKVQAYLEMLL